MLQWNNSNDIKIRVRSRTYSMFIFIGLLLNTPAVHNTARNFRNHAQILFVSRPEWMRVIAYISEEFTQTWGNCCTVCRWLFSKLLLNISNWSATTMGPAVMKYCSMHESFCATFAQIEKYLAYISSKFECQYAD